MALRTDGKQAEITKVGQLVPVVNQNPDIGAEKRFYATSLTLPNGRQIDLLFTETQVHDAMVRRQQNPEDVPEVKEPKFWEKVFSKQ